MQIWDTFGKALKWSWIYFLAMYVNNEIGVVQPLKADIITSSIKRNNFISDIAQAMGRLLIDLIKDLDAIYLVTNFMDQKV